MLEEAICDAFRKKYHLIAVSLDIEKAFEMVWRERILIVLQKVGVNGHMYSFIKNFLKKRHSFNHGLTIPASFFLDKKVSLSSSQEIVNPQNKLN